MENDSEPTLSRTSENISLQNNTTAEPRSIAIQDVQDAPRNTEEDISLQCSSTQNQTNVDREPIFVLVDSSCVSNPSSREILINKINVVDESVNKVHKNKVIPVDTPCTSTAYIDFIPNHSRASDLTDELEMIDINLQSENEIVIEPATMDEKPDSIVMKYLRDKNPIVNNDEPTSSRKISILDNLSKMETIPERERFSALSIVSEEYAANSNISETSLDVHIPSFPASPRSLDFGAVHSAESMSDHNPQLRDAIEFLHQDKDFLVAAEIGNYTLLEKYIKQGTDLQQVDHIGRNALHLAVHSGNLDAVKLLLEAGVNPNIKDRLGMTPLSLCLMRRPSTIVANLLFDHGAVLMPRSDPMDSGLFIHEDCNSGPTLEFVMMCTPTAEEKGILRLLVNKGALINDPEAPGKRQALHFAAMSNNVKLIRILIDLDADLYMRNHRGETPKDVAEIFACKEAYELLSFLEESQKAESTYTSDD